VCVCQTSCEIVVERRSDVGGCASHTKEPQQESGKSREDEDEDEEEEEEDEEDEEDKCVY